MPSRPNLALVCQDRRNLTISLKNCHMAFKAKIMVKIVTKIIMWIKLYRIDKKVVLDILLIIPLNINIMRRIDKTKISKPVVRVVADKRDTNTARHSAPVRNPYHDDASSVICSVVHRNASRKKRRMCLHEANKLSLSRVLSHQVYSQGF